LCSIRRFKKENKSVYSAYSAYSGRHKGISVWVLTQQLTSIAKPFRENVSLVVAFDNPSFKSTTALFDDYGGDLDADTLKTILNY